MIKTLNEYQYVTVRGTVYAVIGMIAYKQGKWQWKEYKLKSQSGQTVWLSIEITDGKPEYVLYTPCGRFGNMNDVSVNYERREYQPLESGIASVTDYFGKVDVDRYEQVRFSDFENQETSTYLSIEDWEGEKEYSFGQELDESEVYLDGGDYNFVQKPVYNSKSDSSSKGSKGGVGCFTVFAIAFVAFVAFIMGKSYMDSKEAIQKYIEKSINYTYVTSVTNNANNKKARVYQTSLSVDEAVTNIIKGVPKSITSVAEGVDEEGDSSEDGGVGLIGKHEYAYVYLSEEGDTYVQVSSNAYMEGQSQSYHSLSRTGYYRTYYSRRSHQAFSSVLTSARQSSVAARKSSGGGTSSGK